MVVIVGLFAARLAPVHAQSAPDSVLANVEVQAVGPSVRSVDPGTVATVAFRVTNTGATPQTLQPQVHVPEGWQLVTTPSTITVPAGGRTLPLVSVSIPEQASVGRRAVRLSMSPPSTSAARTGTVQIAVQAVRRLRLTLLDAPSSVAAGESYTARFVLNSNSNVPVTASLRVSSTGSHTARLNTTEAALAPSQSRTVNVTVETKPVDTVFRQHLTLHAHTAAGDTTVTGRTMVEVIPVAGRSGTSDPRFPVTVGAQSVGDGTTPAGQVVVQGSGDLATDGSRHGELFLRLPSQVQVTSFGRRDLYQAEYATDQWLVRAGDHVYQRGDLAEPGRFGFGGEVRYEPGPWTLGAYGLTARQTSSGEQFAAYLGYEAHPRARVSGSVLHNESFISGTVGTLRSTLVPWTDATLELESGYGQGPSGRSGVGYRGALHGQHSWGSYRAEHLRADGGFPSTTNDVQRSSAYLSVRVRDGAYVHGTARRLRRGLSNASQFEVYASSFVRVGGELRGSWNRNRWSTGLSAVRDQTPYREQIGLTSRHAVSLGPVGMSLHADAGRISLNDTPDDLYYALGGRLSLRTGWQHVSGTVDYSVMPFSAGVEPEPRVSVGIFSRTTFSDDARLSLQAEWRGLGTRTVPSYRIASATLQYELPFGHALYAEGRVSGFASGSSTNTPEFRVGYEVPVGLPIVATPDASTLTGRIVDAATGAGVSDALVRMGGEERFTDDQGRFSLPVPATGTVYLQLDRSSIGFDRVPMRDLPLRIDTRTPPSEVVIPVQDRAALVVDVTQYDFASLRDRLRGEPPEATGGLPRVIVEASDAMGRQRRLTNAAGRATFTSLRPGTWTVRLIQPPLPEDHRVEQSAYERSLAPGARDTLEVRVLPKQRGIQIEQGQLGGDADSTAAPPDSSTNRESPVLRLDPDESESENEEGSSGSGSGGGGSGIRRR